VEEGADSSVSEGRAGVEGLEECSVLRGAPTTGTEALSRVNL
jgi:hypothetical protein